MKTEFTAPSSDGIHTLAGVVYVPQGEMKGFIHIVHGMNEHMVRYHRIMSALCDEGYLCFGYDHLGHGKTARNAAELGYFAPKNGDDLLCRDVKVFSDAVIAAYGGEDRKPYYLMGHSMGSFITRLAVGKYVKPDKFIILGTGGRNPAAGVGLVLIGLIKACRGDHYVSPLVHKLSFGSYNDRFGGGTAQDPLLWLSKDENVRKKYYEDPFCTFPFTVGAMGDLIRMIRDCNRPRWFRQVPRELPILLMSGGLDPVGNYGKGVRQVYERLKKTGHDVRCVLYPNARHEILNDDTYEQVKGEILTFLAQGE